MCERRDIIVTVGLLHQPGTLVEETSVQTFVCSRESENNFWALNAKILKHLGTLIITNSTRHCFFTGLFNKFSYTTFINRVFVVIV